MQGEFNPAPLRFGWRTRAWLAPCVAAHTDLCRPGPTIAFWLTVAQPNCPVGSSCGSSLLSSGANCAMPPSKLQCVAGFIKAGDKSPDSPALGWLGPAVPGVWAAEGLAWTRATYSSCLLPSAVCGDTCDDSCTCPASSPVCDGGVCKASGGLGVCGDWCLGTQTPQQ